jgi:hypothetical protein
MRQLNEKVGGFEAVHGNGKLSLYGDDDNDYDNNKIIIIIMLQINSTMLITFISRCN